MKQVIYINLYRSGVYHRQGKPMTTNLHGGDGYITKGEAEKNADKDRGYIATVRAELELPADGSLYVNPPDSVPTPLSVTQRGKDLLPWFMFKEPQYVSIETHEGATVLSYAEWQRKYGSPSSGYRPTHGGFPG